MNFDDKSKYINLFDFYQKLLTIKQIEYFKLHFIEDLSLTEIAELKNVSKNAVHDSIYKIIKIMNKFESLLHLSMKQSLREDIYEKYKKNNIKLINELKKIDSIYE